MRLPICCLRVMVWGCLFCFCGAGLAFARPGYPPIVMAVYHPKAGGAVEKAAQTCNLCHLGRPPKLNPYGRDVRGALDAAQTEKLTPEILHSIESKDSDGDGANNGAEFAADTLPGDAASKPPPAANTGGTASNAHGGSDDTPKTPLAVLKNLLFPKHAQHPVIVHFPIALLVISLLFDFLGAWRREIVFHSAAYLNLTIAALAAPVAVATGLLAWWFAWGGTAFTGTLLYHLISGSATMLLIEFLWVLRRSSRRIDPDRLPRNYALLGIIAFLIVTLAGHFGGVLALGN